MSDFQFLKISQRNSLPETRSQIFVLLLRSLAELHDVCILRERIFSEPRNNSVLNPTGVGWYVNELQAELDDKLTNALEISAVDTCVICWNCKCPGHEYYDYLEKRSLFFWLWYSERISSDVLKMLPKEILPKERSCLVQSSVCVKLKVGPPVVKTLANSDLPKLLRWALNK